MHKEIGEKMRLEDIKRKMKENRKGFTMTELTVAMLVLVILLSSAIVGLLQYQKYSMYKRNNENAKSIFTAAQSTLSYYKTSGKLEAFGKEVADNSGIGVSGAVIDPIEAELKSQGVEAERLSYVYIPADLAEDEEDLKDSLLYEMTKGYVSNKSIYEASIRIEFDAKEGVVYSVCYCDVATTFVDGDSKTKEAMGVGVANRREAVRRDIALGYWDSDLAAATPTADKKPKVSVELVNEETLELQVKLDKGMKKEIGKFMFTIELYDGEGKQKDSFVVNDPNNSFSAVGNEWKSIKCYTQKGKKGIERQFYAKIDADGIMHIVIDGTDVKSASVLQASNGAELTAEDYKETYSVQRFGYTTEDAVIYAKVQASAKGYQDSVAKESNKEDPMMASREKDQDDEEKCTYDVKYSRHLFNSRFFEAKESNSTYQQIENIVWSSDEGSVGLGYVFDGMGPVVDLDQAFPAIDELKTGSTFNGDKFVVDELRLKETSKYAGLFRKNRGTINEIYLTNAKAEADGAEVFGTVVGENHSVISKAKIEKLTATSNRDAFGGIVGANYGTINEATIEDSEIKSTDGRVGGIAGVNNSQIEKSKVIDCTISAERDRVGGAVGQNESNGTLTDVNVESTDSTTFITSITSSGNAVGGVIGLNENEIKSAAKLEMENIKIQGNEKVGGIVGENTSNASITNYVLSYGEVTGTGNNVGGVIGYNNGDLVNNTSPFETIVSQYNSIEGQNHTGGVIGEHRGGLINGYSVTHTDVVGRGEWVGGIAGNSEAPLNTKNDKGISVTNCVIISNAAEGGTQNVGNGAGSLIGKNGGSGVIWNYQSENNLIKGKGSGGVVGMNYGLITATKKIVTSGNEVIGRRELGGLIGYNQSSGTINNYEVDGVTLGPEGGIGKAEQIGGAIGVNRGSVDGNNCGVKQVKVHGTSADCVGGVVGKNESSDALIRNFKVRHFTVVLEGYAESVGGLVGLNAANSTVDKMDSNQFTLKAAGMGNVGGAIGNNSGIITTCGVKHILLDNTGNYSGKVGGYIGSNNAGAFASGVDLQGIEIYMDGADTIGGYVGENAGTLTNGAAKDITIRASGYVHYVGGVIGRNNTGASANGFELTKLTMQAYGSNETGGAVGVNSGTVQNGTLDKIKMENANYATKVGGFIGLNNATVNDFSLVDYNLKSVGTGEVGGAIGSNAGAVSNGTAKTITVNNAGGYAESVGGFVGKNDANATVKNFKVEEYYFETSGAQEIGGVAGYNLGIIEKGDAVGVTLENIVGYAKNVGGIIGKNNSEGILRECGLSRLTFNTPGESDSIGGVSGCNDGEMKAEGKTVKQVDIVGTSQVGGVAGYNTGTVVDYALSGKGNRIGVPAKIISEDPDSPGATTWIAYFGGAVGRNQGILTVTGNKVTTTYVEKITGCLDVGGVVGMNENGFVKDYNANIGTITNVAGRRSSSMGGIVGNNDAMNNVIMASSPITAEIGAIQDISGVVADPGNHKDGSDRFGGVAGQNKGIIRNYTATVGKITSLTGDGIGVLVGLNHANSFIVADSMLTVSVGSISGKPPIGDLAGTNEGTITNYTAAVGGITPLSLAGGISGYTTSLEVPENLRLSRIRLPEEKELGGLIKTTEDGNEELAKESGSEKVTDTNKEEPTQDAPKAQASGTISAKLSYADSKADINANDEISIEQFSNVGFALELTSDEECDGFEVEAGIYDEPAIEGEPTGELIEMLFDGEVVESEYVFQGLNQEYANDYLLIRVKTTDKTAEWSEYICFQLPKVQMSTPELVEETYTYEGEANITKTALRWKAEDEVLKYTMYLTNLSGPTDEPEKVEGEIGLVLDTNENAVSGYEWNDDLQKMQEVKREFELLEVIEPNTDVQQVIEEVRFYNYGYIVTETMERMVENESLEQEELPQGEMVQEELQEQEFPEQELKEQEIRFEMDYVAVQKITTKDGVYYRVVLPDVTNIDMEGRESKNTYLYTSNVTVRAQESADNNHGASLRRQWVRLVNETDESIFTTDMRELTNEEKVNAEYEAEGRRVLLFDEADLPISKE